MMLLLFVSTIVSMRFSLCDSYGVAQTESHKQRCLGSVTQTTVNCYLKNQGALVTIKCSKRISRRGSRNERFLTIENFFSALKKEITCGINTKSCVKSIVTEADTCITESSEIETLSDFSE